MGIFDLFKKKETGPIRPFSSDADKFSTEQIWDWMNKCSKDPAMFPPTKSDEYAESIIVRLDNESDIEILSDDCKNGIRIIQLSIERNGSDFVSISYSLFNPNVIYITTAPFAYAGNRDSFLAYCNRFQDEFPMISIGCRNFENEIKLPNGEIGVSCQPLYSIRTCIPLLGNGNDYINLLTASRCLPIYGYDLRDGYHSGKYQPYPARKSGINKQLNKLVKIHEFNSADGLFPAQIALYGSDTKSTVSTNIPAKASNPYLQYLNYCNNVTLKSHSNEIQFFHINKIEENGTIERSDNTQLVFYSNYPGLYTFECHKFIKIDKDDPVDDIFEYISNFSFPSNSNNPHELGLFKISIHPYGNSEDTFLLKSTITQCIPNEINAQLLAMQIVDFFDICSLPISTFAPKDQ